MFITPILLLFSSQIMVSSNPLIFESNHTLTKRQNRAPYFELLATGLVAGIAGILAPNTGKVIMIERLFGGTAGNVHAQELDYTNGKLRALTMTTDAYCSGGFISPDPEARIFNAGGYSGEALKGILDFTPCGTPGTFGTCDLKNLKDYTTLKVARWYPTLLPLPSGRIAVMSGTTSATGFFPYPEYETNVEFIPPLPSETNPIPVPLFLETMADSLYPIAHVLPDGQLFLLAGNSGRVVNPDTFRTKVYLPDIAGKRTYPLTGGSILLPLKPSNKYEAEVLVCGGSSDYKNDAPALSDCGRIVPLDSNANWTMEEMPFKRAMPSLVLLPDETVFITSGAQNGWGGFGAASDPTLTSVLYDPKAPLGSRFTPSASSTIGRLYHNGALLLDDGRVLIFGSTPNADANAQNPVYPDEKRIEVYYPPYLLSGLARPVINNLQSTNWAYNQTVQLQVTIPSGNMNTVKAVLLTNGFVTHSLLMVCLILYKIV